MIYQIVTGVTSDVGVPSTHLFFYGLFFILSAYILFTTSENVVIDGLGFTPFSRLHPKVFQEVEYMLL